MIYRWIKCVVDNVVGYFVLALIIFLLLLFVAGFLGHALLIRGKIEAPKR